MKKSVVVLLGLFAAASFGAAVGFAWLWRSSVRESRDATERAVAAEAMAEDLQRMAVDLEMELKMEIVSYKGRVAYIERDKKELVAANKELNQMLKERSDSLFKAYAELRRAREALLKESLR